MISIEVNVTGPQIANSLINDEEEFSYFLKEVADNGNAKGIAENFSLHFYGSDIEKTANFLREIADHMEQEK